MNYVIKQVKVIPQFKKNKSICSCFTEVMRITVSPVLIKSKNQSL